MKWPCVRVRETSRATVVGHVQAFRRRPRLGGPSCRPRRVSRRHRLWSFLSGPCAGAASGPAQADSTTRRPTPPQGGRGSRWRRGGGPRVMMGALTEISVEWSLTLIFRPAVHDAPQRAIRRGPFPDTGTPARVNPVASCQRNPPRVAGGPAQRTHRGHRHLLPLCFRFAPPNGQAPKTPHAPEREEPENKQSSGNARQYWPKDRYQRGFGRLPGW